MTKKPWSGIVFSQFCLAGRSWSEVNIGRSIGVHRRLVHRVDGGEWLAVVETGAGHGIVDRDGPEQRRRNVLGQVSACSLSPSEEVAIGVDESHWVLRADVLHVDGHARAGRIGHGEEAGARIDVVEGVRGEGGVAGEDIAPTADPCTIGRWARSSAAHR